MPGPIIHNNSEVWFSFDELIQEYELCNHAEGKSPKTISWYNDILRQYSRYLKNCNLATEIKDFSVSSVRDYILYLRNKPKYDNHPYTPRQTQLLSPRTIQCHVRALKAFSTWLYREGYSSENILLNYRLPRAPSKIIEPLSEEEINKIINCINIGSQIGVRNRAILVTVIDTGLRASEIANISLADINLNDGYIKVMGKGAKERIVPIGKYVQMILWSYIDKVRPEPINHKTNNLFLSRSGKPITVNAIKLIFSRLAKSSNVSRLYAHLCRHTFAINYLMNGGDIFSLKEILGHTTLDMVNHYLHFTSAQITALHRMYSPMDKLTSG